MKNRVIILVSMVIVSAATFAQPSALELTFTAVDHDSWIPLDSIKIMNLTQGGDTVLYYPDTLLSVYYVGLSEITKNIMGFQVFQNYPNPMAGQTTISLYVPDKGRVTLIVTDMMGRVILQSDRILEKGLHTFRFIPGSSNLYFFTACWKGSSSSIKIIQSGLNPGGTCLLEYCGSEDFSPQLKAIKDIQGFFFTPGDELLFIGYADTLQSGMLDAPEENTSYTFQFATNIPCPRTPTVEYEGQAYNTIQIFSQCWLKENLNVGTLIPVTQEMTNNWVIEKYCYNNEPDSCIKYGGLYQWSEMMKYSTHQGGQGICPPGWHLPTDEEWKVLEGAVDSQYGIGDPLWDSWNINRGYDAGTNLKTTSGWAENSNGTDLFGFSGLPGGYRYNDGCFLSGTYGWWWTSTEFDYGSGWERYLSSSSPGVDRDNSIKEYGFSVRCIRDQVYIEPIKLTFSALNDTTHVQMNGIRVMNRTQGCEKTIIWPDTTLVLQIELPFNTGDELLMIGYSIPHESGILSSPDVSQTYTFQFATNIPCPGTPTVTYGGQVYNTIQIYSQCWLKENLNVGTMIPGAQEMTDNGITEKYCYDDNVSNCNIYGGLYQWDEMMKYTTQQGVRGICPPGWHLPTDEEWKVLEGSVDSLYGIGDPVWEIIASYRGYDAGANLKTTSGWYSGGNGTDLYGFSGQPAGARFDYGSFDRLGHLALWWTSTVYDYTYAWARYLYFSTPQACRNYNFRIYGFSVRCIRD